MTTKKRWRIGLLGGLLLSLIILVAFLLSPRHYPVIPHAQRLTNQFWHLPSGSKIAYFSTPSTSQANQPYPILYLHGGPGGAIFHQTVAALSPLSELGFSIFFYDQLGSGNSDRLSDITGYTIQRHIDDLHAIIEQLQTNKVILIGQSWGAILATAYLAAYPLDVHQLILTSPGPLLPLSLQALNTPAPDSLLLRKPYYSNQDAYKATTNLRMRVASWFAIHFGYKLISDTEADAFADYVDSKGNLSTLCDTSIRLTGRIGNGFYSGLMTYQSLLIQEDFRPKLRKLKVPVLVMKGQCDNQPWGATQEYLNLLPYHQFAFIPDAGHAINIEQPERYLATIRSFLMEGKATRNFR